MGLRKGIRLLAVGLYLAVTRLALLAAFVFACLFFVLNSRPFPDALSNLLRQVLPGTLAFGTIQISPVPWRVDVLDVHIDRPDGERVVRASSVRVHVNLLPLLDLLVGRTPNLLHLHFARVRLRDFDARIVFNDDMHFEFVDAFDAPGPGKVRGPDDPPGLQVRLSFDDIDARDGTCFLRFPEWDLTVRDIRTATRLFLTDGKVRVESTFVDIGPGQARIRALPELDVIPRQVEVNRIRVEGFLLDGDRLAFDSVRLEADGIDLEAQDGGLDWGADLAYRGEAFVFMPDGSPVMRAVSADRVHGAIQLRAQGRGDFRDPRFTLELASPALTAGGRLLGSAALSVSGGRNPAGIYELAGISAALDLFNGSVRLSDGSFQPFGDGDGTQMAAMGVLDLARVSPSQVMDVLGQSPPGAPLPIPTLLDATLQVRLELREVGASPAGFLAVSGVLGGPIPARTVLAGREVSARIDALWELEGGLDQSRVRIHDLDVRSGSDLLRLRGELDLPRDRLSMTGSVRKDLASLLSAFGIRGQGVVTLSDLVASGAARNPSVRAALRAEKVAIDRWAVDTVQGAVAYGRGEVSAVGLRVSAPFADVAVERMTLGLLDPGTFQARRARVLSLTGIRVPRVVVERVPMLGDIGIQGTGRLEASRLSLDLAAPLRTLSGDVSAAFDQMGAADRVFEAVRASARLAQGEVQVSRASADLRGGGTLEVSGKLHPQFATFDARVSASGVSLAALAGTGDDGALQGRVDLDASGSGRLADPTLSATASLTGLRFESLRADRIVLEAEREPGEDLRLQAPTFLPRMRLNPQSGLSWHQGRFRDLVVMIDINRLTPQDLLPTLKVRDLWARMTGHVQFRMDLAAGGAFDLELVSPPDGLRVGLFNREVLLTNQERLQVDVGPDGAIDVTGLSLWDGRERLRVCGRLLGVDGNARLLVRGGLGAYGLRALKDTVSMADGYLYLQGTGPNVGALPRGCAPDMGEGDGSLMVTGPLPSAPALTGVLRTGAIEVGLRRVADTIRVQPGGRIRLAPQAGNRQVAEIDADHWVRGAFGDGALSIFGNLVLRDFVPDSGEIGLTGAGIRVVSPGEFYVVANPALRARFQGMAESGASDILISGQVAVIEGSYHKNFDVVKKAFSGFTGRRVADRSGRSLAAAFPWLDAARLDVGVAGSRFGVRSKVVVGSTDLELGMNLRVRGTVGRPELWNRVEIQPGGRMTYDVVRRQFEVVRGTLDFTGPPAEPIVDLTARTRIEYTGGSGDALVSASRFSPDDSGGGMFDDSAVLVTLAVSGRYPDLDIELSSNSKSLTQTDLQYLLLTGSTQADSGGQMSSTFNLGLLTEDVTNLVTKVLLGSFVDAINFGISPSGGVNVDVMAHMGSRLKFDTRVLQGQGSSRYSAGFHIRLTERLSLQGRVRGVEQSMDPDEIGQTYETKLRYRIPIE